LTTAVLALRQGSRKLLFQRKLSPRIGVFISARRKVSVIMPGLDRRIDTAEQTQRVPKDEVNRAAAPRTMTA